MTQPNPAATLHRLLGELGEGVEGLYWDRTWRGWYDADENFISEPLALAILRDKATTYLAKRGHPLEYHPPVEGMEDDCPGGWTTSADADEPFGSLQHDTPEEALIAALQFVIDRRGERGEG